MLELKWTEIEHTETSSGDIMVLESATTPGGWLYRTVIYRDEGTHMRPISTSMAWAPAVRAGSAQAKKHAGRKPKTPPAPQVDPSGDEEEGW